MKIIGIVYGILIIIILVACQSEVTTYNNDPHPNMSHQENSLFATPDNPVESPSGDFLMVIEAGYNDNVYDNHFVIYKSDKEEQPKFISSKKYRTRDRLYFLWDEADNIWVYSGDSGTALWLKDNDTWSEQNSAPDYKPVILQEALE